MYVKSRTCRPSFPEWLVFARVTKVVHTSSATIGPHFSRLASTAPSPANTHFTLMKSRRPRVLLMDTSSTGYLLPRTIPSRAVPFAHSHSKISRRGTLQNHTGPKKSHLYDTVKMNDWGVVQVIYRRSNVWRCMFCYTCWIGRKKERYPTKGHTFYTLKSVHEEFFTITFPAYLW